MNYERLYSTEHSIVHYCNLCDHKEQALFKMEEHIEKNHLKELEAWNPNENSR